MVASPKMQKQHSLMTTARKCSQGRRDTASSWLLVAAVALLLSYLLLVRFRTSRSSSSSSSSRSQHGVTQLGANVLPPTMENIANCWRRWNQIREEMNTIRGGNCEHSCEVINAVPTIDAAENSASLENKEAAHRHSTYAHAGSYLQYRNQ